MLYPLSKEHDQRALDKLRGQGIEMTREELIAERKAAYKTIRLELRKRGFCVPESDIGLFKLMIKMRDRGQFPG